MAFLNEYISEGNLQKYKLRERFKAEIRRFPREPEGCVFLSGISFWPNCLTRRAKSGCMNNSSHVIWKKPTS